MSHIRGCFAGQHRSLGSAVHLTVHLHLWISSEWAE